MAVVVWYGSHWFRCKTSMLFKVI